tara:strand:- start:232 stop:354 length:123 start_codon:yes stop_codon:yes gene_type:complete
VDAAEAGNNALSLPDGGFAVMEADSYVSFEAEMRSHIVLN